MQSLDSGLVFCVVHVKDTKMIQISCPADCNKSNVKNELLGLFIHDELALIA